MQAPLPGDVLKRRKGIFTHKGIYLGNGRVVHSLPGKGVHLTSCAEFAAGHTIRIRQLSEARRLQVLQRLNEELSAGRAYDPFTNNCQHVVNRMRRGISFSEEMLATVFAVATAGVWVFRKLR